MMFYIIVALFPFLCIILLFENENFIGGFHYQVQADKKDNYI